MALVRAHYMAMEHMMLCERLQEGLDQIIAYANRYPNKAENKRRILNIAKAKPKKAKPSFYNHTA